MEPTFSSDEEPPRNQIVISSSSPPLAPQPPPAEETDCKHVEVSRVNPPQDLAAEAQHQKTSIINALAMMEEIQEQDRKEVEANRAIRERVKQKEKERQAERQLRKEFQSHSHLPASSLLSVKRKMAIFPERFKMQVLPKEEAHLGSSRYEHRKQLTRAMLLAIEELRTKVVDSKTQLEQSLLTNDFDIFDFCYKLASELQSGFYKALKKQGKEQYRPQIKLVLREFSDKNNLAFRRNVLNRRLNWAELAKVDDEALKCEKTKEEERERIHQLVRESQKDPMQIEEQREEEEPEIPYRMGSFQSAQSLSSRMEEEVHGKEEARLREKEELGALFEQAEGRARELQERREERMRVFLESHLRNQFFKTLCDSYDM